MDETSEVERDPDTGLTREEHEAIAGTPERWGLPQTVAGSLARMREILDAVEAAR